MQRKVTAAALLIALLAAAVWAESAVVRRNRVDILKGKGSLYLPPLATAQKGESLEILAHDGRWLRVRFKDVEGYVLEASLNSAQDAGVTSGSSGSSGAAGSADAAAAAKGWDATVWARNKGERTDGLDAMRATRARVASDPARIEKFQADMNGIPAGGSRP